MYTLFRCIGCLFYHTRGEKIYAQSQTHKISEYDGIQTQTWKMLVTEDQGNGILFVPIYTNKNKTGFPREEESALLQTI